MISREKITRIDQSVRDAVRAKTDEYLRLLTAETNVDSLSEYVGSGMLGDMTRYALDKYFGALAKGEINAEHGYDEDRLTTKVMSEVERLTGAEKVVLAPSGTAANLSLLTSFVDAYTYDDIPPSLLVWSGEHTLNTEGKMLSRTGIRVDSIRKLVSPANDGILEINDLEEKLKTVDGSFIVQIAIPTIMGVVPSMESVQKLAELIHSKGGKLLVDGARLTNALAYWGQELDCLSKLGVDGFTLGSSKKGQVVETVCIRDTKAANQLRDVAKSFGHTSAKMSPLAYATGLFFTTDWWKDEADSENKAASDFSRQIGEAGIQPAFPVQTNMVFVSLSKAQETRLATDPRLGLVYNDYHSEGINADPNIGRIAFTGYLSQEEIATRAQALIEVKKVRRV